MGFYRLSSDFYVRWVSDRDDGLDDESLLYALELIRRAGYERATFYEREKLFEPAEWLEWVRHNDKTFFLLYRNDGDPISTLWLDGFSATGRQAFSHFCTFKTGRHDEFIRGGKQLFVFIGQSTPIIQVIGVTPSCYRHALRLAYELGYVRASMFKKAVLVHNKERDAILTIKEL